MEVDYPCGQFFLTHLAGGIAVGLRLAFLNIWLYCWEWLTIASCFWRHWQGKWQPDTELARHRIVEETVPDIVVIIVSCENEGCTERKYSAQ